MDAANPQIQYLILQLDVRNFLREVESHGDEAQKLGTQRTWMTTWYLPLLDLQCQAITSLLQGSVSSFLNVG